MNQLPGALPARPRNSRSTTVKPRSSSKTRSSSSRELQRGSTCTWNKQAAQIKITPRNGANTVATSTTPTKMVTQTPDVNMATRRHSSVTATHPVFKRARAPMSASLSPSRYHQPMTPRNSQWVAPDMPTNSRSTPYSVVPTTPAVKAKEENEASQRPPRTTALTTLSHANRSM